MAGLVAALLLLGGCSDWLDVKPRGRQSESGAFSDETGFQSTLIGAYTLMASTNLYGENVTMYIPEFLAQHWVINEERENPTNNEPANWLDYQNHRDNDWVRNRIDNVWLQYYKAILQLNVVLANLADTGVDFSGDNKALIEGEAKGLRAFLHLDLLRFFGPMPQEAVEATAYVPYMTELSRNAETLKNDTWKDYIEQLQKDLNDAKALLKDIDPITVYIQLDPVGDVVNDGDRNDRDADPWHLKRQRRFNYFAAVATEARLKSWLGDKAGAAELAREVIDAKDYTGNAPLFPLSTAAEYLGQRANYTFNSEHIFGVSNSDLTSAIEDHYLGRETSMGITISHEVPLFKQKPGTVNASGPNSLYDIGNNLNDIRGVDNPYWVDGWGGSWTNFRKYVGNGINEKTMLNRVPLIRAGEMYLLVFEGMDIMGGYGQEKMEEFITARGLMPESMRTDMATDKMLRIEKEYRKEFFAEGQMFFFYKRLGYTAFTWPASKTDITRNFYVLEQPLDQTKFYTTN